MIFTGRPRCASTWARVRLSSSLRVVGSSIVRLRSNAADSVRNCWSLIGSAIAYRHLPDEQQRWPANPDQRTRPAPALHEPCVVAWLGPVNHDRASMVGVRSGRGGPDRAYPRRLLLERVSPTQTGEIRPADRRLSG